MDIDLARLHTNQRLLVQELIRRGAVVRAIDYDLELMEVTYQGRVEYILDRTGKHTAYLPSSFAADKYLTKFLLRRHGIDVPEGGIFDGGRIDEALAYADKIGFPLVVKPNVGSHGEGVRSGINGSRELQEAIYELLRCDGPKGHFLIERHIDGHEHRIFITRRGDYAILLREPAFVTGDGKSTIRELAENESDRRQELKKTAGSALCPIALDQVASDFLRGRGMDFNFVPARDEKVYLRLSSNLAQGGTSTDMTDRAHPSVIALARNVMAAFDGLPCLGIDFLTPDIVADQAAMPYAIIEVNANPGLAMHHMPASGQSRDVAGYLADAMFPLLSSDG